CCGPISRPTGRDASSAATAGSTPSLDVSAGSSRPEYFGEPPSVHKANPAGVPCFSSLRCPKTKMVECHDLESKGARRTQIRGENDSRKIRATDARCVSHYRYGQLQ